MFHLISQPMIVNVEENYPINSISPRSAVFHSLDLSAVRRVELDDRHHRYIAKSSIISYSITFTLNVFEFLISNLNALS